MKAKDLLKLRFLLGSHYFPAHSLSSLVLVTAVMLVTLGEADCVAADTGRSSAKPGNLMEMIEVQMKWREKVEAENRKLKEELEILRSESAVLSQTLKQMAAQRDAATNHLRYLAINDYLMENRAAIAASLQKDLAPKRDTIFSSLWSQGRVLEFEVSDIFLYQTNVVVSVGFVWSNPDSSGGAGRANILMDPLNEYVVTGSSIQDQMRISAQELAALREGPPGPARTDERAARAQIARVQESPPKFAVREAQAKLAVPEQLISEETKNKLIGAGIAVATQVALNAIDNYFKQKAAAIPQLRGR